MKSNKKMPEKYMKTLAFFVLSSPHPWCKMLQTLERQTNVEVVSFCQGNTLLEL